MSQSLRAWVSLTSRLILQYLFTLYFLLFSENESLFLPLSGHCQWIANFVWLFSSAPWLLGLVVSLQQQYLVEPSWSPLCGMVCDMLVHCTQTHIYSLSLYLASFQVIEMVSVSNTILQWYEKLLEKGNRAESKRWRGRRRKAHSSVL